MSCKLHSTYVNYHRLKSVASCFIDPTFRVDLNPTTLTNGHDSRQHFQPCDLPREFTGVCFAWFGRSPPYHFHGEVEGGSLKELRNSSTLQVGWSSCDYQINLERR